jgi:hypothetical protein
MPRDRRPCAPRRAGRPVLVERASRRTVPRRSCRSGRFRPGGIVRNQRGWFLAFESNWCREESRTGVARVTTLLRRAHPTKRVAGSAAPPKRPGAFRPPPRAEKDVVLRHERRARPQEATQESSCALEQLPHHVPSLRLPPRRAILAPHAYRPANHATPCNEAESGQPHPGAGAGQQTSGQGLAARREPYPACVPSFRPSWLCQCRGEALTLHAQGAV